MLHVERQPSEQRLMPCTLVTRVHFVCPVTANFVVTMVFESGKNYWCIIQNCIEVVKPWEGTLHISENVGPNVYSVYPVEDDGCLERVDMIEPDLYHTKEEARAAYIKIEAARLGDEKLRIAIKILELAIYRSE